MARRSSNHADWGLARFVRNRRRFEQAVEDWEIDEFFSGQTAPGRRPGGRIPVLFGTSRLAAYGAAGGAAFDEETVSIVPAGEELNLFSQVERRPVAPALAPPHAAAAAIAPLADTLHRPAALSLPATMPTAARTAPSLAGAVCLRGLVEGFMAGLGAALLVLVAIRMLF